jgi:transcriptional regulator with XRE-family HTH domain
MSEKLKQLRKEKGKTLKEVAQKIGISLSAYSNYEQGIREPSYEILKKICAYYEVTADYLLGLED